MGIYVWKGDCLWVLACGIQRMFQVHMFLWVVVVSSDAAAVKVSH